MIEALLGIVVVLLGACLVLLVVLWRRGGAGDLVARFDGLERSHERVERFLRDELAAARREAGEAARDDREELGRNLKELQEEIGRRLDGVRTDAALAAKQNREESTASLARFSSDQATRIGESFQAQNDRLDAFARRLAEMAETHDRKAETLRAAVEQKLKELREENTVKLEEMRRTVDEKLQGTLERRLGESFKHVSERLEQVHKGLGEMQALANGVGDLKRVMTNVKTRGTWGEVSLGTILDQLLTPEQYESNVAPKPHSGERVEFAIRLPGRGDGEGLVYLPIDAKFPTEDYQRLVEAQEAADVEAVAAAAKQLENAVKIGAKAICEKYISPPHTTDFAILYLPSEGLYAEAIRRTGLVEHCQREHRVVLAGPTTLSALLNSLQMGFRTLAIQQRSSEVWEVLGAVKTEFGKFGGVLERVKKKLQEASNTVDNAEVRTRAMDRALRAVEALPVTAAEDLLGLGEGALDEKDALEELVDVDGD